MTDELNISKFEKSPLHRIQPLQFPLVPKLLLKGSPDLQYLYLELVDLDQMDVLHGLNLKQVSEFLRRQYKHMLVQIGKLENLGLILRRNVKTETGKENRLALTIPTFPAKTYKAIEKLQVVLLQHDTPEPVLLQHDTLELSKMLDTLSNLLKETVIKPSKNETSPLNNIYNTNTFNSKNNTVHTETYVPPKPKKKAQHIGFAKIQYNQVLNAYNRISGVARKGNEMQTAWRQVRAMFLAGRKPEEIIRCMEWMEEHKDERQFEWLKFWTMGTVQKRLPDFLAGRFTNEEEDDGLEQLN